MEMNRLGMAVNSRQNKGMTYGDNKNANAQLQVYRRLGGKGRHVAISSNFRYRDGNNQNANLSGVHLYQQKDIYGNELAGAAMQILDSEGNIFDEWASDGSEHVVTNIPAGSYTLKELASPDGYVIATEINFTIDIYNNVTVEMAIYDSVDNAKLAQETQIKEFDNLRSTGNIITKDEGQNYYDYTMISNGYYMVTSRIENTLVFSKVPLDNKDIIENTINSIGY